MKPEDHFSHTKERLKERYALDIDYREYMELCTQCSLGEDVTPISQKINNTYRVYRLQFKNRFVLAVFNETLMLITTVLPS